MNRYILIKYINIDFNFKIVFKNYLFINLLIYDNTLNTNII